MKRLHLFLVFTLLILHGAVFSQTARQFGLRQNTPQVFAFTNADIVTEPGRIQSNATLVIRDGIIEAIGRRVDIPADATVIDMTGKTIYPGFIDMFANYGLPQPEGEEHIHWNAQIRSHYSSAKNFRPDADKSSNLRSQGFVAVHTLPEHGLLSGYGSVTSLGEGEANHQIIRPDFTQALSFRRSMAMGRGYPTSGMGTVALVRQTMYDADWYAEAHNAFSANRTLQRPETNHALEALSLARQQSVPFVVEAENELWFLKAIEIADEFGLNIWVRGSGREYRRLDAIRQTGKPIILPINFPSAPNLATPEQSMNVSLEALRHWYLAPENPSKIAQAGLTMALTAHGSGDQFMKNLRTAVERGLKKEDALAALTTTPARLLGISDSYGSLSRGKVASFIIADGDIFEQQSNIEQVWIDGKKFQIKPLRDDARGKWLVQGGEGLGGAIVHIEGTTDRLRGTITLEEKSTRLIRVRMENNRLVLAFSADSLGLQGVYRMSANLAENELLGVGEGHQSNYFAWSANRTEPARAEQQRQRTPKSPLQLPTRYPSMEFGLASQPEQVRNVLIRNATIWTQGPEGIMENADMLVTNGKIAQLGYNIAAPRGAVIIDAAGRHVTPGLIDPHIHASIAAGVNETGDAITSETRITDVMDGDNVWIYRLLAGGITSATLFHGSANPIGGQNAVIKMRWGLLPDGLLIEDATPGLKMALGENVKRSMGRYPSSRQGTEQIIRDAFQAAVEYGEARERWTRNRSGIPVRRDLTLEPILEVIKGDRLAYVHAYRQDEMLMMLRVAEDFGFTVGTFEHGLEGYKIADELREHGAAAVVWSDWSAFKVESYDGILHNAKLLNDVGVLTTLHSDNTQLSTRMNWEAAKTMRTGVSEIDAMNFITLNPAKVMGIDHRTGSLEPGKDADFVIWNGHPMSTFSTPDQTWVDGRKYFDRDEDMVLREQVKQERALLISRILEEQQAAMRNDQE